MAKLYFRYGAMGSSKTANAIMVQYNYGERHQKVLMVKPQLENRDGERIIRSRSGLETECVFAEELEGMDLTGYDCVIVDEAQFLTKAQVEYLVHIVDDLGIPEGSMWLMAWADTIEEVKTICWCGKKATCNARVIDGKVAREGEQIVLGGDESYVSLCRKHWRNGDLGPLKI